MGSCDRIPDLGGGMFHLINIYRPRSFQFLAPLILGKGKDRLAWQWEHGEGGCSLHGTQEARKQETGD